MRRCPDCRFEMSKDGLKCPNCGRLFDETSSATAFLPSEEDQPQSTQSTESADGARFPAGTMLADRYRIVTLLGRGGMGEVYKAEDLKLKQIVALKFLPDALALDAAALARFHNEVRITRQISHPNVCRVYDIGEAEGMHFLSMEFIDGEDLSLLLRPIGRLPSDKATETARQICAGLAAAHDNGVLHRDLKPANIMIDGRGKARVTDFGVAVVARQLTGAEAASGTAAYMAPEQLRGEEVTQRSDIYSLGLVLYELFTGKRVYESNDVIELLRLHEQSKPTTPSSHIQNIDPLIERVILRCLEKDPNNRPASAIQIAAALPGGDPLAAALAAGETPSPEMVAASGENDGLRPAIAAALLAATIIGVAAVAFLGDKVNWSAQLLRNNSPEMQSRKAQDIIRRLGYAEPPIDSAAGFQFNRSYEQWLRGSNQFSDRWSMFTNPQPPPILFWYRQSPRILEAQRYDSFGWVTEFDPAYTSASGLITIHLDPTGRLTWLIAVPPQVDSTPAGMPAKPDWSALFAEAGLPFETFNPTESTWTPLTVSDSRAAWTGVYPGQPDIPIRVEAAFYRSKPVYFAVIAPWTRPWLVQDRTQSTGERIQTAIALSLVFASLVGAALLARHNFRRGRSDGRGALKVALVLFTVGILSWLFGASHTATANEVLRFVLLGVSPALLLGGLFWLVYVALEPFVRRRWPDTLISWTRLLSGNLRDPRVGRDILAGIFTGVLVASFDSLENFIRLWVGSAPTEPVGWDSWLGIRYLIAQGFLNSSLNAILVALVLFFMMLLWRVVTRRQWIAVSIFSTIGVAQSVFASSDPKISFVFACLNVGLAVFVMLRLGLLALGVSFFTTSLLASLPITTDFKAWYSTIMIIAIISLLSLAGWAFHTSLGGQKLFQGSLLED